MTLPLHIALAVILHYAVGAGSSRPGSVRKIINQAGENPRAGEPRPYSSGRDGFCQIRKGLRMSHYSLCAAVSEQVLRGEPAGFIATEERDDVGDIARFS